MSETNGNGNGVPEHQANGRLANGRFAPGVSGNPAGPKPGLRVSGQLAKLLDEKGAAKVADVILARALEGDARFVEILLDRYEGKVSQHIVNEGTQTQVNIVVTDPETKSRMEDAL